MKMEKQVACIIVFLMLIPFFGRKGAHQITNKKKNLIDLMSKEQSVCEVQENSKNNNASKAKSNSMLSAFESREEARNLSQLLLDESAFIYFHLHIENITTVFESDFAIEPSTFIMALKGKGYYLLTLQYDFVYLSLGTLSPGVHGMEVNISLSSDHFGKESDENKEKMLVQYLRTIADTAFSIAEAADKGYQRQKYKICIEKKPIRTDFTDIRTMDTIYQCWKDEVPEYIEKEWLINVSRIIALWVAAFSPLVLVKFTRKHPPAVVNNEQFVETKTDIPIGLHHLLFHSSSDSKYFVLLRNMLCVFLLTLLPHIRWTVYIYLHGEIFIHRLDETFFHKFSSFYVKFIVAFVLLMTATFWICTADFTILSSKKRCGRFGEAFVNFIRLFWTIPSTKNTILHRFTGHFNLPPQIESSGSELHKFCCYNLRRFQTIFYPPLWSSFFANNGWRSIFLIFPFFICLLFYSVPFLHVPYQPYMDAGVKDKKVMKSIAGWPFLKNFLQNIIRVAQAVFKFVICVSVMVYTNLLTNLFIAYLMEILSLTIIGLLVNYNSVQGAFYAATIFVAFFLKIFIQFYDDYKTRLRTFIDVAVSIAKQTFKPADQDMVPHVSWKMFLKYLAIYKPIYVEVTKIVALIIVLSSFATFVFHHMIITKGIADVPSVANAIGLLILARVFPTLNIFTSQEKKLTEREEVRAEIKNFLLAEESEKQILFYFKENNSRDFFSSEDVSGKNSNDRSMQDTQMITKKMVLRSGRTL